MLLAILLVARIATRNRNKEKYQTDVLKEREMVQQ